MSQFVFIENGQPAPTPDEWLASLPAGQEKETLQKVWKDHQDKVTAANGHVPPTDELRALIDRYKAECKVLDLKAPTA